MINRDSPELSESDFIQERYRQNPYPLWIWLFLCMAIVALLWGGGSWFYQQLFEIRSDSPFLRVTNRQFSLFLWQNPSFMRVHVKNKRGYLPAFRYGQKITMEPDLADEYVVAPPEVLFYYHAWDRLVKEEFAPRPIDPVEFQEFLEEVEEWQPPYWSAAPEGYIDLVQKLPEIEAKDLQSLSTHILPKDVRIAFQGWKNYFKEGEQINAVAPTFGQMQQFLRRYPHYARNYWRNIVSGTFPNYLKTLAKGKFQESDKIPPDEVVSFLKVAFFNAQKAKKIADR